MKNAFWRLIQDNYCEGDWNMATDLAMLRFCETGRTPPTLRLYGWGRPTLSIGRYQDSFSEVNLERCRDLEIPVVRRPTGGKAVLHEKELAYSVAVPANHPGLSGNIRENIKAIGLALLLGLQNLGVKNAVLNPGKKFGRDGRAGLAPACFASLNHFEILVAGKKLVGSAAKRTRGAFLQHGSILLDFNPERCNSALRFNSPQARKKSLRALKSSVTTLSETLDRQVAFEEIQKAVQEGFQQAFSGMLSPGTWLAGEEVLRDDLIPTCQVQALEKVEPPVLK